MSRSGVSALAQVLSWAAANSAAGAVIGLAVGPFRDGGFEAPVVLMSVLFGNVVGFTVLVTSIVLFPRVRTLGPVARGALLALALVSGSVAGTALVLYLFPLFVLRDLRQAIAVAAIVGVLALIVGAVAYTYEELRWRLAESLREVEEVRLVEARLREEAARAQLAALQARINPHFFFNTLNTIASLLQENPARAEEVVETLADLFRYTFRAADAGPVPLAEELAFVRGYLRIEQARFGERLRVAWDVDADAAAAAVPGLILQPVVENAIVHGVAPAPAGGTVRIRARLEGPALVVEVEDDGPGPPPAPETSPARGHGLDNVRGRLLSLYREAGTLEILASERGRGTLARLRIPASVAVGNARADAPGVSA